MWARYVYDAFVGLSNLASLDQIVHGDSAIIGYARENRGTIHADHSGMAKFSRRDNADYKKILYAIEMILEHPMDESTPGLQSM